MRLNTLPSAGLILIILAVPACGAIIHQGGEFEFESGFTFHTPSIFGDRDWDQVGNGWGYWGQRAVFMPPQDRYGHPNFNANQFPPNVSRGTNSQEITMTSANGDAIMWKTFAVTPGHRIRCRLDAITTPSEVNLMLWHAIGQGQAINFYAGVTDPNAVGLAWQEWDINDTNNHFATYSIDTIATGNTLTYYFWMRHTYATASGATLCFDNLIVEDLGAVSPTPTITPVPTDGPAMWLVY